MATPETKKNNMKHEEIVINCNFPNKINKGKTLGNADKPYTDVHGIK